VEQVVRVGRRPEQSLQQRTNGRGVLQKEALDVEARDGLVLDGDGYALRHPKASGAGDPPCAISHIWRGP
jgi:hypothetical protein